MECLDANAVQDLMADAMDADTRRVAMSHLDECDDCRGMVSLLAKDIAANNTDGLATEQQSPRRRGNSLALLDTAMTPLPNSDPGTTMPSMPPLQSIGRKLGRYTLVDKLGSGAMGIVFRAKDPELGRDVALKLLHIPSPDLEERLVREARSMAKVNHPNVVAVYDVGIAEDSTYIAMELVTGTNLRAWQSEVTRPIPEILQRYIAAGRGLAAAHAAGVIHRDFKPDNILLGTDERVRVTDFGLAAFRTAAPQPAPAGEKKPRPSPTSSSASVQPDMVLTEAGTILGTPAYMAPEQYLGGNLDGRTDQFAFCVSLYEALYNQRPFTGKTYDELAENVCEGRLRPLTGPSRVSPTLRAIVLRGLSLKPGDRYPSMEQLLVELGRDRAKPFRRAAIALGALAIVLGLGIGADYVARDRVAGSIGQSFAATGLQVNRAFGLLAKQFAANANQVYYQRGTMLTASHRDDDAFGLGDPAVDAANRKRIHEELVATDWSLWRQGIGNDALVVAVADGTGRLFYTSAAPERWDVDVNELPWITRARAAGKTDAMLLESMYEPTLVKLGLLGPAPAGKLAFFFTHFHFVNSDLQSYIIQALDARQLIPEIALDDETQLSITSPDGVQVGDVPDFLAKRAPADGTTEEVAFAGSTYLVRSHPLTDLDGDTIGRVVMARQLGGVLTGLFPGARNVFTAAMLLALLVGGFAAYRARQITNR